MSFLRECFTQKQIWAVAKNILEFRVLERYGHFVLPLLIILISIVFFVSRALIFILTPLKQPCVIAEIIVKSPPNQKWHTIR